MDAISGIISALVVGIVGAIIYNKRREDALRKKALELKAKSDYTIEETKQLIKEMDANLAKRKADYEKARTDLMDSIHKFNSRRRTPPSER
jgi:hypothetical protein